MMRKYNEKGFFSLRMTKISPKAYPVLLYYLAVLWFGLKPLGGKWCLGPVCREAFWLARPPLSVEATTDVVTVVFPSS